MHNSNVQFVCTCNKWLVVSYYICNVACYGNSTNILTAMATQMCLLSTYTPCQGVLGQPTYRHCTHLNWMVFFIFQNENPCCGCPLIGNFRCKNSINFSVRILTFASKDYSTVTPSLSILKVFCYILKFILI